MTRDEFKKILEQKIIVLDGASGTLMQSLGLPNGVCPEKWALENKDILVNMQKGYVEAGSDIIYTFTFGGSRAKLKEFGLEDEVYKINKTLVQYAKEAAGDKALVAGDLAPTGMFIKPYGENEFEDIINIYKEQIKALLDGGVDLFVIETMMDIQEARAALIAVKESCDLPVILSITLEQNGRMLTGTDPIAAVITLQSLGADVVGLNCSTGPKEMLNIIKKIKPYAKVPISAKPNAGLPKLIDGKTVFDMEYKEFGEFAPLFREAGVNLIGGCCGTTPLYIKEVIKNLKDRTPIKKQRVTGTILSSMQIYTRIHKDIPLTVIGERINPTGKKKLQAELKESKYDIVKQYANEQIQNGAKVLDINAGMPGIDEKQTMVEIVNELILMVNTPLCLDSTSPEVIEAALRIYPGRALINSISLEEIKIKKLLPIAAKYGAAFILLPLSDEGVPKTADERVEVVEKIYNHAKRYNYDKDDIIIDGLVMTVSSDQEAALETLKLVKWSSDVFGVNTVLGLSNVSFGLPERKWVNSAFFAMAVANGLTTAICNPSSETLMSIRMACDVLKVRDKNSKNYISYFNKEKEIKPTKDVPCFDIYKSVINGESSKIYTLIKVELDKGTEPSFLVDNVLIPAITEVGDKFDKKEYFLPQLIQSAEAMKKGFEIIEPLLKKEGTELEEKKTVVIATVKGDIHDIGKNIVALMLKNYGFNVIDLGKDVSTDDIINNAKEMNADIIALSALMTTTMTEMAEVVKQRNKNNLKAKIMIGGAVITKDYAKEIGAEGYSSDAYGAVKTAKELTS